MYVAIDTEAGGAEEETSLLTVYLGVYNSSFEEVDCRHFHIKPDDGLYKVTPQGMAVNQIDLVQHDSIAELSRDVKKQACRFLYEVSSGGAYKLIPIGHGVAGDIRRITSDLVPHNTWHTYVSYRTLDTGPIGQFLKLQGKIPETVSGSLGSYADHFGIVPPGPLHDARTDGLVTVAVLKKMLEL